MTLPDDKDFNYGMYGAENFGGYRNYAAENAANEYSFVFPPDNRNYSPLGFTIKYALRNATKQRMDELAVRFYEEFGNLQRDVNILEEALGSGRADEDTQSRVRRLSGTLKNMVNYQKEFYDKLSRLQQDTGKAIVIVGKVPSVVSVNVQSLAAQLQKKFAALSS